jgi:hypothetical protein
MIAPGDRCGGCKGLGAHSRRCRTRPGWFWYRLQDDAECLGDMIGSNDCEAANMAYAIAVRMRARAEAARSEHGLLGPSPGD